MQNRIYILGFSNGLTFQTQIQVRSLSDYFRTKGYDPVTAWKLWDKGEASVSAAARVQSFLKAWEDEECFLIADPSGGELANQILPYLTGLSLFPRKNPLAYWGMSDNTILLNTRFKDLGITLLHGWCLNLVLGSQKEKDNFDLWSENLRKGQPFPEEALPPITVLRGTPKRVAVWGGNLRCFCKLLGTPYQPSPLSGDILLLESLGSDALASASLIEQLIQARYFQSLGGLLIGKFSKIPHPEELFSSLIPQEIPLLQAPEIGHGKECLTLPLGQRINFTAAS